MTEINISKFNKADVLASLYNNSKPLGLGLLQYDPNPMTTEEAELILDTGHTYFDYLKGRVMKVDLSGGSLRVDLYDRDNGPGAAAMALADLVRHEVVDA